MKQLLILVALTLSFQAYAQDDNTLTLVVSGQGKTQDEAKQNALRSAIEQAFGTFISSETVINNDSFVSDNITSLSQGSVLNFEILSSNSFPDSSISLTMKAVVSITEMQKLTESKGHSATIAGGLFGMNLKLLKLQSDSEAKVILDLARKSIRILEESMDFNLEIVPPKKSNLRAELTSIGLKGHFKNIDQVNCDNSYKIRFIIEARPNANLDVFIDYFLGTMNAIKMTDSEIDFAEKSGLEYYKLNCYTDSKMSFCLRNIESISYLNSLFCFSTLTLVNYDIISNDGIIRFTPIFKEEKIRYDEESYNILSGNGVNGTVPIQILDSSHYVLMHGYMNKRNLGGTREMDTHYPSDFYRNDYDGSYTIILHKVSSNGNFMYPNTQPFISHDYLYPQSGYAEKKTTPLKDHINVRYQVIDYFLPLSDVEKLASIKVSRHHE